MPKELAREEEPVRSERNQPAGRFVYFFITRLPVKSWLGSMRFVVTTLALWVSTAVAYAQPPGEQEAAAGGKSYVVSYMVVVLAVALGLLVVCRSGGRSNEPKLEDLE
jgi:hypothetical protein